MHVVVVRFELHVPHSRSLKEKRAALKPVVEGLRSRFSLSVAEVDHQDKWQRATLLCALVGGRDVEDRGAALERFAESRCPDGCSAERDLLSLTDIRG